MNRETLKLGKEMLCDHCSKQAREIFDATNHQTYCSECGFNPTQGHCQATDCQECCPHAELDHSICIDCGYEVDPGIAIDRAHDTYNDS